VHKICIPFLVLTACGSPLDLDDSRQALMFCGDIFCGSTQVCVAGECVARSCTTTGCPSPPNAYGFCGPAGCEFECASLWADCDGNKTNGCETAINTASNCYVCGATCVAGANETASCSTGICQRTCAAGWGDCDGNVANGCETSLNSNNHCHVCDNVCGGSSVCTTQGCVGCGNGICERGETHTNCPDDCECNPGSYDCCGDGVCRSSCGHILCL
jgi:hypothetical protein